MSAATWRTPGGRPVGRRRDSVTTWSPARTSRAVISRPNTPLAPVTRTRRDDSPRLASTPVTERCELTASSEIPSVPVMRTPPGGISLAVLPLLHQTSDIGRLGLAVFIAGEEGGLGEKLL